MLLERCYSFASTKPDDVKDLYLDLLEFTVKSNLRLTHPNVNEQVTLFNYRRLIDGWGRIYSDKDDAQKDQKDDKCSFNLPVYVFRNSGRARKRALVFSTAHYDKYTELYVRFLTCDRRSFRRFEEYFYDLIRIRTNGNRITRRSKRSLDDCLEEIIRNMKE